MPEPSRSRVGARASPRGASPPGSREGLRPHSDRCQRASDAGRAGLGHAGARPPAREALELRRVGHVALIAWAPVGEADRRHRDVQLGKARQQLEQAHGVARAAPEVEHLAGQHADARAGPHVRIDGVVDVQQIAHLPTVAVDRDRLAAQRLQQKVRDPALILGAELARPVQAAHAEHHRAQAEHACVVEHVSVPGALEQP